MPTSPTVKETVEFDGPFLDEWNKFCDSHGLRKRLASHACRVAFMQMAPAQREELMGLAKGYVLASRTLRNKKKRK